MSGVEEARLRLEKASIGLSAAEATSAKVIELTKELFSKGYKDVELIGKVTDAQICYVNLLDAGHAENYQNLDEDIKLSLLNDSYIIEDGIISDSATIQSSNPKVSEKLSLWLRAESDYFNLKDEEDRAPSEQVEALVGAAKLIADGSGGTENLDFILRPTELHNDLLRALMEARGVVINRIGHGLN